MLRVIHAFPENDEASREMHLRYWYGTVRPDEEEQEDPEAPVVCWCGGRHIRMSNDTVAVWHVQSWHDRGI